MWSGTAGVRHFILDARVATRARGQSIGNRNGFDRGPRGSQSDANGSTCIRRSPLAKWQRYAAREGRRGGDNSCSPAVCSLIFYTESDMTNVPRVRNQIIQRMIHIAPL